ncbi:tail assembly chaperone [Gordonia phage BiteSize]|uniref:Tail assembly chaperone n=3 Tax=Terapinvirus terapin TaxID=2734283 RepID=A0A2P1N5M5_9CAUD|nr:tail assembly chaperone [Gordonia phage Djokovic]QOC56166.1 tail assembly chaperone [Gordonia phage Sienna]QOC56591.1 tail assembly chaperone [Gordonia phage BiteSize]QYW00824.1 tail assembly chaperone [Gordonia phage Madi]
MSHPTRAFFLNRGIWLFCKFVESEVEQAGSRVKNASQAQGLRQSTLMKHLYPDDPTKRFRTAQTPTEKAGPSASGEEFFAKNFGQRRGL